MNYLQSEISKSSGNWWVAVFSDVQFWIPFAVLLIGLLLLYLVE